MAHAPTRTVKPAPQPGALAKDRREPPPVFRNLADARDLYQPSPGLEEAVDAALRLGAPLLITGEPGTGKTQVAYWLAWRYGLPIDPQAHPHDGLDLDARRWQGGLFKLHVRSTSTADELTAGFDTVAYFHAANRPGAPDLDKRRYVVPGPLFKAYRADGPSVVLIDEIDKAPRDFPNDLLDALDQHTFEVPEVGETIGRLDALPPPLVVITSNTERRLPAPFLRRCVYHHIVMSEHILEEAQRAHLALIDPGAPANQGRATPRAEALADTARQKVWALRNSVTLVKRPSTSEFLAWLAVLLRDPAMTAAALEAHSPRALPRMGLLIKTHEDRATLGLDPTR